MTTKTTIITIKYEEKADGSIVETRTEKTTFGEKRSIVEREIEELKRRDKMIRKLSGRTF